MQTQDGDAQICARRSLDVFFSTSVRAYPNRPALFVSGRSWSYVDLDETCRSIERALDCTGRAHQQCNIALIYGRSAFSYAAVLAIMRSNSVYVPLNSGLPAERLCRILEDAGIEVLVLDSSSGVPENVLAALRQSRGLQIIVESAASADALRAASVGVDGNMLCCVSTFEGAAEAGRRPSNDAGQPAARLAYIIYTSGSTGVPKGVPITHESACRCIEKVHRMIGTCEHDRFSEFSALSFDVSVADLFLCWKSGGALYVPSQQESLVPLKFAVTHELTVWSSVPSLANFLLKLRLLRSNALPKLRFALFCGEVLPVELAQAFAEAAPRCRVYNVYGPTECTIFSTCHEYQTEGSAHYGVVPIGVPLPGLQHLIMDEGHVVQAEGEVGELWLSGDQLAQGYWRNSAATAAAFVTFPPEQADRQVWYRTGDLVSWDSHAGLLFKGRIDRQIKLRGFRIELQEIESVLRDVIGCALVAVIPLRNAGGMYEKIVAYCDEQMLDETTIKARCAERLPSYSIPERIFQLDSFPVSNHGKIDYRALAALSS